MRYVWMTVICIFAALEIGCVSRTPYRGHWFTGTCNGACNYYARCKALRGEKISRDVHAACEAECRDVFSSKQSILAFESLVCEDAVAFVEGTSGRVPGEPLSD